MSSALIWIFIAKRQKKTKSPQACNLEKSKEERFMTGREAFLTCMKIRIPDQSRRNVFPLALRVKSEQNIHNP